MIQFFEKTLICLCKEIEKIFFLQCCQICGKITSELMCDKCKKEIYEKTIFKIDCIKNDVICFDTHIYIFKYEGKIRKLILDYKFNEKSYLYKIFSEIIIKNEKICGILKNYDIIIPIPIHKKRKKQRGYNQSELIAKEIAQKIPNLEYKKDILEKIKNTKPQSTLGKKQRKENAKNAYKIINEEKINNKKIIIFDDIYTTGSTVNEVSKILKEKGASKVIALTIAKD